jgi:hypothetical protein
MKHRAMLMMLMSGLFTASCVTRVVPPTSAAVAAIPSRSSVDVASVTTMPAALPSEKCDQARGTPVDLIDPQYPRAIAGQNGYGYQKVASADFDGDGDQERAFLIANAEVVDGEPLWDDGHVWQMYIEEPTGERTYVFVQFEQLGTVNAITTQAASGHAPTIVLVERTPFKLGVYEVQYCGPEKVKVRTLAQRALDPSVGFAEPTSHKQR